MPAPIWREGDPIPAGYRRVPVAQGIGTAYGGANWRIEPIPGYVPQSGQAASSGLSPATTTAATQYPSIPEFGLPDIQQITDAINQMTGESFRQAAGSRIPGQAGLEAASSADIQALLSPGEYFPGTSREAAEVGSLRGVPGSGAAESTWVRMTDAERLARMGLGQQFLTAALARNPIAPQFDPSGLANYLAQLPGQRAQLLTQQQQFAAQQQQQRDLALAQLENAWRIAQMNALRAGGALRGSPQFGGGGFVQNVSPNLPRPIPAVPLPTPEGWGQAWSEPAFPDVNQAFPQVPFNQGWDLPLDIPIDFDALAEPEDMYA